MESVLFVFLLFMLFLSSYLVARKVFKVMHQNGNRYSLVFGIISFLLAFGIIGFILFLIIVSTMDFGR